MEDYFKIFSFIKTPNKVLLIILFLLVIWLMTRKPKKYPPGPLKWPIVGNMFQMRVKGKIHLGMRKMSRKYGEVVGMFAGNSPVILISGLDALKEATTRDDLNGRAPNEFQKILNNGRIYGFSAISGDPWKIQRRFTLHHLRDFGFGKSSLEVVIHDEIKALFRIVDHISGGAKENFSKPFSFHDILSAPLLNTLWFMMSGQRYEHDHPKFKRLTRAVKDFLHNIPAEGGIINAYPTVAKLLPGISKLRIMQQARDALHKIIQEEIDDHRKTIDYENPRDFIDTYIREIDKQKADPTTTFNEEQLKQICMDLFLGGTDTTYNSILAVMLRMVVYPEIQSKVHEELDQVIGRGRLPSLEDKAKLPYLEATIHESQRLNFVSPVGVPRAPVTDKEDIFFRGYNIPKESRILFDLFGLAHDPKYWHETKEFKPERFLNQNGRVFQPEAFIPFSSGKRNCLGESLAKNNLFLFVTSILQRYTLKVPCGYPNPSMELYGSFVLFPKRYEVQIELRK